MTKDQLETQMNVLIHKIDAQILSLKAIKNYRYDSMCTDFYRSLTKKRSDLFAVLDKLYNYSESELNNFDFTKYYSEQEKKINGLNETLIYLKSRPAIKNPY